MVTMWLQSMAYLGINVIVLAYMAIIYIYTIMGIGALTSYFQKIFHKYSTCIQFKLTMLNQNQKGQNVASINS
jgi:hypothetical protein